jgi:hypothetical protein
MAQLTPQTGHFISASSTFHRDESSREAPLPQQVPVPRPAESKCGRQLWDDPSSIRQVSPQKGSLLTHPFNIPMSQANEIPDSAYS